MTTATREPLATEAAELLATLTSAGVILSRRGDRLHIEDPYQAMTREQRASLAAAKPHVLALLSGAVVVPDTLSAEPVQDAPAALSQDTVPNADPETEAETERDPNAPTWPCGHCGPATTWVWHPRRGAWFCAGCIGEASEIAEGYDPDTAPLSETLSPVLSLDAYATAGPVPLAACPACAHSGWVVCASEGTAARWECGKCGRAAPTFYAWEPGSGDPMPTPAEVCACGAHRWGNVTGIVGCLACRKPWPGPSRERSGAAMTAPQELTATPTPTPEPQTPGDETPEPREASEVSTSASTPGHQDTAEGVTTLAYRYASETLGAEWKPGTPAFIVGRRLILKVTTHRDWYYKPTQTYKDLPEAPTHRGHGLKVGWRRLPTAQEAQLPHVHVFDRSSAYLAVCSSVDLPVGTPRWVEGAECVKEPGIGWRVGLWHVSMDYNGSPWNGRELPAICEEGADLWLWTPVLRAALDCGYRVTPESGAILWYRDDGTRGQTKVLEAWQKHVWAARRTIETDVDGARFPNADARHKALSLVKSLYQWTIGAFKWIPPAREMLPEEIEAGAKESETWRRWYHPEWENLIRAEATSRAFYAARKSVERGISPTIMHVDNIGFPSDGTPAETAERAGLLTKPESCGAWRHEYTAPMSLALEPRVYKSLIHIDGEGHRWPTVRYQEEGGATNG